MSSKLQDIRQAVAEYQKSAAEYNRVFKVEPELATDYEKRRADDSLHSEVMNLDRRIDWLTDLLAIAEAAQDVLLYHPMCDSSEHLDKLIAALAKLEGE